MALSTFEKLVSRTFTTITAEDLENPAKIGDRCFYNYKSLTSITIPNSVKSIGEYALSGCTGLTNITIPSNVKIIGFNALSSCSNLENISLNIGIENIGRSAFRGCTKLTNITIPESVANIGNFAFSNSTGTMAIATVRFEQPENMNVTLPTAGSSTGMFYVKTARSMSVYTDNLIIKNYAWSTDNITATLYHLDGTPWE